MIPPHFITKLEDKIADAIKTESGHLADGMAADHGDYQARVGQIKGYRAVQRIIMELTEDKEQR